ncbi:coiled-coil domain-containing protein R3HCC1L [Cocos nucifera]|uniref:Coiled-coil domain-containing protein R3HCC1L n=1 Tax=Cocos nucifera TaxID=13894 RepID=A0A8K0IWM4_COCNU|nr:coiled-coil domain-containing protein R3HCC1L [Cocos nucifera]
MDEGGSGDGWSEAVEDLVEQGDVDGAISVLESVVSKLETRSPPSDDIGLASALSVLADLHSSRGFSLKADELRFRAFALRAPPRDSKPAKEKERPNEEIRASGPSNNQHGDEDEDWEAIADRGASEEVLLSLRNEAASSPSRDDPEPLVTPKRRGRGSFLYQKSYMYSDQPDLETALEHNSRFENETEAHGHCPEDESTETRNSRFGTSHVLVLYDFPPSTRTMDLEKLFEKFKDHGVAIRWVNDTVALAVFRTPAVAHEAQMNLNCPFKVRSLVGDDDLRSQLTNKDLEPPYPRPKTSARTAQRLIAQGMGIKPSTKFGSSELRKQEEARKNRIHARQTLRDDAWGSDNP